MKAVDAYNLATLLATKATALAALLDDATKQGHVDEHSAQSWFGLPDSALDDIKQAYDLVVLVSNKLNTALTDRTTLL